MDVVFNSTQEAPNMKPGDGNKIVMRQTLETIFGPECVATEFKFHPVRRWRFDYAIPDVKLAFEYNGHGGFVKAGGISRHGSIIGMTNDAEKMNAAISFGWRVLTFTALHFSANERFKRNLTDFRGTVMNAIAAIQEEKEKRTP